MEHVSWRLVRDSPTQVCSTILASVFIALLTVFITVHGGAIVDTQLTQNGLSPFEIALGTVTLTHAVGLGAVGVGGHLILDWDIDIGIERSEWMQGLFIIAVGITLPAVYAAVSPHLAIQLGHSPQANTAGPRYLALFLLAVPVIGVFEELVFRGLVQRYLATALTPRLATLVAAVLFGLVHAPFVPFTMYGVVQLLNIIIVALGLGAIYADTESLTLPIALHGAYDCIVFGLIVVNVGL